MFDVSYMVMGWVGQCCVKGMYHKYFPQSPEYEVGRCQANPDPFTKHRGYTSVSSDYGEYKLVLNGSVGTTTSIVDGRYYQSTYAIHNGADSCWGITYGPDCNKEYDE